MTIALTRALSPRINECELSFLEREPIDYERAVAQHDAYERCLESLGCTVVHVDPAPEHPDGVFVEDAAVIFDHYAWITRPGADSRRGEIDSVAKALAPYRDLRYIEAPSTMDGGDVLRIGDDVFIGRSARTNFSAAVEFTGCLHLKSAVTAIGPRTLLFNPEWVDVRQFGDVEAIAIDPDEPLAANALRLGDAILLGEAYRRTRRILESRGYRVVAVDISELARAEAGVTCCSLIID